MSDQFRHRMCAALQVAAQAFTFIVGGYETTASALAFAVHFIAHHQDKEAKLLAEIDAFGRASEPSYDDLSRVRTVLVGQPCTTSVSRIWHVEVGCCDTTLGPSNSIRIYLGIH